MNITIQEHRCVHCARTFTTAQKLKQHTDNRTCRRGEPIHVHSGVNTTVNLTNIVNISIPSFTSQGKRDFGKERWDHITMEKLYSFFESSDPCLGLIKLIDEMYFNPEMPQNHTTRLHPSDHTLSYIVQNGNVYVVSTDFVTSQMIYTNSSLLYYVTNQEISLFDAVLRHDPSDPINEDLKVQQDFIYSIQKWVNNHMMRHSRDSRRNFDKLSHMLAAHLILRSTNLPSFPEFYSKHLTCNEDEIVPPPAANDSIVWQNQLMQHIPIQPLSSFYDSTPYVI